MSSSIQQSSTLRLPFFEGTHEEAKTLVKGLEKNLRQQGVLGNLVLHETIDSRGTKNLAFRVTPRVLAEDQKVATASYLTSIIEAAYPDHDGAKLELMMVKNGFASYLESNGCMVGREEAVEYLQELHIIELRSEGLAEPSSLFSDDETEQIIGSSENYFSSKNIQIGLQLGEGAHGIVYETNVNGDRTSCVYKKEVTQPERIKDRRQFSDPQFWRQGDCAASRLRLPSIAKTLLFIVVVQKPGQQKAERYSVPANKMKLFGMELPDGTRLKIEGQLMERAQGENLNKLMTLYPADFAPGSPRFTNITRGLFESLREMQGHNLAHRDIKPDNIIYNPATEKVTLIDFGSAERLRKLGKINNAEHFNPVASSKRHGTLKYIAPSIFKSMPHGSEVDFFSYGMILLESINRREFNRFGSERFGDSNPDVATCRDVILSNVQPEEYLPRYLETISQRDSPISIAHLPHNRFAKSNSPSASLSKAPSKRITETSRILARHPELREIINLSFQVSGGGAGGEAAFGALCEHPYFRAC